MKYLKYILPILILILLPLIFNSPMNMRILIEIGIFSIIVLGLNLLMGFAGQISLGHAGFFGLSAYITGILSGGRLPFTLPVFFTIPIAIILTTTLCFLIAIPILKLKGHYLAMATLSIGIIFFTIFVNMPFGGGFDGFAGIPRLWIFGEYFTGKILKINKYLNGYIITYLVLVFLLWISRNLEKSKFGRAFMAIHTSEIAASTLGIDVTRYKVMVFTISGLYASIAGVLFAHFYCGVTPGDFGTVKSITFVTMLVIGGSGSVIGGVIGTAFLITVTYSLEHLQDFLRTLGVTVSLMDYNIFIYGFIFLLVLIFLPDGLTGLKNKFEGFKFWRERVKSK
ncbi:MAG TPA: branched-chain amino acid ABC transporter permease [Spirochaetota bacterium]|nr:branched-chain amino acid ABC transporter permease [Spirochaetota bacterium]